MFSELRNGRVETALAGTTKEYVVLCELRDDACIVAYLLLIRHFCPFVKKGTLDPYLSVRTNYVYYKIAAASMLSINLIPY